MNIEINGRKIAYSKLGNGQTVVLLHGFCEDKSMWDNFEIDESNCQVLKIDFAGFGQSDLDVEVSMKRLAEDVRVVLEEEKITECILIGHSMGGYVALAFAEMYPKLLNGVGLFHSHPFADTETKKPARQKSIEFVRKHGARLFVHQLIPDLFPDSFKGNRADFVRDLVFAAEKIDPEAIALASCAMLNRPDCSEILRSIDCPVLFIIGDLDTAVPLEASLQMTFLPKVGSIHVLRGVGHMGMYEAKTQTEMIVGEFIDFVGAAIGANCNSPVR